jgi:hypothetical protein
MLKSADGSDRCLIRTIHTEMEMEREGARSEMEDHESEFSVVFRERHGVQMNGRPRSTRAAQKKLGLVAQLGLDRARARIWLELIWLELIWLDS